MSTKQVIIDGYLNLGMQNGFDNISMNDIANYAQIKKATIFSHFKDYDQIKRQAVDYCMQALNSSDFEINPNAKTSEEFFINLINSFIDILTIYPINALLSLLEQKHTYNEEISTLYKRIDLMISSRFRVALDYCVQRSWTELSNTDDLAVLFATYLRELIVSQDISDETLSGFIDMILTTL